jgi:hypothetical protein
MYQRDYLQKQLELLGLFIATVFGKKEEHQPDYILEAIEKNAEQFLGIDKLYLINEQIAFEPNEVIVTKQDIFIYGTSARLLYEKANAFERQTKLISAEKCREKSIQLFEFVKRFDKTYSEERERILEELKFRKN